MKSGRPRVSVGIVIVRAIRTDGREAPMKPAYVIAMDAHCRFTEFYVTTPSGRPARRGRTPTTLPTLRGHGIFVRQRALSDKQRQDTLARLPAAEEHDSRRGRHGDSEQATTFLRSMSELVR